MSDGRGRKQGRRRGKKEIHLELVEGDLHRSEIVYGVELVRGPEHLPPFPVEAVALEEDTCLVLSTPVDVLVSTEHPIRVMTEVNAASPQSPGSVVVRSGSPLRFLAVVHDLDEEPSWREEWVASALAGIIEESEARGLRAIGLPMIGTLHGSLSVERFLALLQAALREGELQSLQRIWVITGPP
jgi:hypothetical protein